MKTRVLSLSRTTKKCIALTTDVLSAIFTVWLVFFLHHRTWVPTTVSQLLVYIAAPVIAIPVFIRIGLYHAVFHYNGIAALRSVLKACAIYGVLFFSVVLLLQQFAIPGSIGLFQPIMMVIAIGGSRAVVRLWLNTPSSPAMADCGRERIMIYGAGLAGIQIAGAIAHSKRFVLTGFLDDNPELQGHTINSVKVINPNEVDAFIKNANVESILIAIPSASRSRKNEIYVSLKKLSVRILTLPGIEAIADGRISISYIKDIEIEDLLGRDPVAPVAELLDRCISGKVVLVTGAGGSIGSELCRQIYHLRPSTLLLLDHSEFHLYSLHNELQSISQEGGVLVNLVPLLGNVTDEESMERICSQYNPSTVYHAAAYKHVPMVEQNPFEGIRNNVFGTLNMARTAVRNGVCHFILISTDKAVRPTSIMGASKRLCELVLQALAAEKTKTCFSMVRFGNVLGSSGSVVPLFRRQIKDGGPLTITHKDITRYFMTIPEAAQLVIQAGAMATGGDVFLLDMGEPVKIIDLARRMIELSGLSVRDSEHVDGDIEISITGLRPGEKLYEELLIADNPMLTDHPRIFKAHEYYHSMAELMLYLTALQNAITNCDEDGIRAILIKVVRGFKPSESFDSGRTEIKKNNGVTVAPKSILAYG